MNNASPVTSPAGLNRHVFELWEWSENPAENSRENMQTPHRWRPLVRHSSPALSLQITSLTPLTRSLSPVITSVRQAAARPFLSLLTSDYLFPGGDSAPPQSSPVLNRHHRGQITTAEMCMFFFCNATPHGVHMASVLIRLCDCVTYMLLLCVQALQASSSTVSCSIFRGTHTSLRFSS